MEVDVRNNFRREKDEKKNNKQEKWRQHDLDRFLPFRIQILFTIATYDPRLKVGAGRSKEAVYMCVLRFYVQFR